MERGVVKNSVLAWWKEAWSKKQVSAWLEKGMVKKTVSLWLEGGVVKKVSFSMNGKRHGQ
jgi:hypothetical protein